MPRAQHARQAPFERKEADESAYPFEKKRIGRPFSVKATDDVGSLEGHGAVFDAEHETSSWALGPEWKDVIRPGAFSRTLAEHKRRGTVPLMLWMHERGNIPGVWRSVDEDKDGLKVAGQVSLSAKSPSDVTVHELLKMGAINGLSIGFRVRKHTLDEGKKLREILDVDLAEISIVDIPGGPTARVTDVKAGDPRNINFLETVLRDAGLSRKEAKTLLVKGFAALRDVEADPALNPRDADRSGDTEASPSIARFSTLFRP